jgi:hypothetical protein
MCSICRGSRIYGVVVLLPGRSTMLQWKPRLVAVAAILALLIVALGGAFSDQLNLYW